MSISLQGVSLAGFLAAIANHTDLPNHVLNENMAKNSAIILGFLVASASVISAVASWWAATVGGDHRDTAIDLSHVFSFKKKHNKR